MSANGTLLSVGLALLGVALLAPALGTGETFSATSGDAAAVPPDGGPAAFAADAGPHELRRASDGHFYAEAEVNGVRIRFLVDTGASFVALTPEDARRAGVSHGWTRGTAMGAGGAIEVSPATIDRMRLGPVQAVKVRGAVIDELPVSLLGQSFLSEAEAMEIRGDMMVLR